MRPVRLRFKSSAPAKAPKRVRELYFSASSVRQFQVRVSARAGVDMFGFSYAGTPVSMSHDKGSFNGKVGQKGLLEWVMVGQPGGTMKVTVLDGTTVIAERAASTILPPYAEGYDALEILP